MAKIPRSVENGFVVFSLLLATSPLTLIRGRASTDVSTGESSPLLLVLWLGIYAITFLLLLAIHKRAIKLVGRDKVVWLIVGIALLSTLWSVVPMTTFRRGLQLAATNVFGLYLATRYSLEEQLRMLAWALGIGAILSLAFAVALPAYGVEISGAWRGIYVQKNVLARLMVLSAMIFLLLAISIHKYRWMAWTMFGLSSSLILLSSSKTGLVNLVTLLVLFILFRALRLHYTRAIPLLIFVILAVGSVANWLWSNSAVLLQSLGKDATLTGRTELWDSVLYMIWKRPILGYGYDAFWTQNWNSPAAYIWNSVDWHPNHAHNGILNLWLELGLLGLLVYLLGYLLLVVRAVGWLRVTKTAVGFWPLIYVSYIFLYNQTESSLVIENSIFWIIYAALSFSVPIQHGQTRKIVGLSTQK